MDFEELKKLDDAALKATIRAMPRAEMDAQFQRLGAQYALLCQRLEAIYTTSRETRFAMVRPGGLSEIDHALQLAKQEHHQEMSLLTAFRDLNRVISPFMDAFETQVFDDLKHMSKDELMVVWEKALDQLKLSTEMLAKESADYRKEQNAAGTRRLAALFKDAIRKELTERFGYDPQSE